MSNSLSGGPAGIDPARTARTTVILLAGVYIVDYVDRVAISIALPYIGSDLEIGKAAQGLVVAVFAVAYMLAQLPGGLLADRYGARRLLVISLLAWSVFTALTGLVTGLGMLLVVRGAFGIAQALFPSASFKALAERTTPDRRSRSAGIMLASNAIGAGIGTVLMAPLVDQFGWRHSFWMIALCGAAIGLLLWRFMPPPLTGVEQSSAPATSVQITAQQRRNILGNSVVWRYAAMFCAFNMLTYGMITWMPSYLLEARDMSIVSAGVWTAVPMLVSAASMITGGWLMGRYFDQRPKMLIIPVLCISAMLLIAMLGAESVGTFLVLQAAAMACSGLAIMGIIGMPLRSLPPQLVGGGMGVVNTGGQLAGVIAPLVMGWLAQEFGYGAAFGFLAASTVCAAAIALVTPADLGYAQRRSAGDAMASRGEQADGPAQSTQQQR